jgi:valyl-tRNA synthetase
MEKFEINNAAKIIYSYVWSDFCDWYIELMKNRLYSGSDEIKSAVLLRALKNFENLLKIVHPFMPFITETLAAYKRKKRQTYLIISSFDSSFKILLLKRVEFVQDVMRFKKYPW